jgi:phenylalanyl-tRNA synthetase beta chain
MKISLNWLKEYIEIEKSAEEIAAALTQSGLEVEGVEKKESIPGGMEGIVIGKVITCEKHPDADKLSKTTVDIGGGNIVPIVCGAPNVAAGQKVVVATVNSTLYPTVGEPFKIKKAKIRGEVSEGMICAEDEIGVGNSHAGIIVLETDLPNGTPASEYFNIKPDHILEIGLTPNRADAASHIGVARDLKAILDKPVSIPSVENFYIENQDINIEVVVENFEACPRYSGVTIKGVEVKDSPEWLKQKLNSIGLESINNIVDVTNFVLHELGQPLHAFDADQIKGGKVVVKTMQEGSNFTTLDGKERKLKAEDLMICNTEEGMCIAGVFGGVKSGISNNTKNVFLESAYFSPDYIRKTSQTHGLKTDASFRYERGTDPLITVYALKRAALLIKEVSGGAISCEIKDVYKEEVKPFRINVKYRNIDRLIGKKLPHETIFKILHNLDVKIEERSEEGFLAIVPPYRVDVQREADIIEEILRIYGYDNIEISETLNSDFLAGFPEIDKNKVQSEISQILSSTGYFEIITNSLTSPQYSENLDYINTEEKVEILNKLSEDLGVMRQSLLFSGLEVLSHNINRRQKDLKLYEFGKIYYRRDGKFKEENKLSLFISGNQNAESWLEKTTAVSFHGLASAVYKILFKFNISNFESDYINDERFEYGLQIKSSNKIIAELGKVNKKALKVADLKQDVFFADLNWDALVKSKKGKVVYEEVSKYPEVRRDLSLVLDKNINFDEVKKIALKTDANLIRKINVFDVYEGENLGSDKKAYAVSFIIQDKAKTLTDQAIDKVMNKLISNYERELNAIIRK